LKSKPKTYTVNGEKHTLSEWSEITGISYGTLYNRIYVYGYSPKQAILTPPTIRLRNMPEDYRYLKHIWEVMRYRSADIMSKRWYNSFDTFYNWCIDNGWKMKQTLVRKDTTKGWLPSNVIFCDPDDTFRYRHKNPNRKKHLTYDGKNNNSAEFWAEKFGYSKASFYTLISKYERETGEKVTDISQIKHKFRRLYTYNGETHTLAEWSRISGIYFQTLWFRIFKKGWSIDKAINTPTK